LKSLAVYIDGLCGLIFTVIGISILWQSVMSLS
jgi:hypothetical protein